LTTVQLPTSALAEVEIVTPSPETLAALRGGMRLLDPDIPQSIVGWRGAVPTQEAIAETLGCGLDRARGLRSGKERWTPEERAKLCAFMASRWGAPTSLPPL
jgi:hypothetical protein